MPILNDISKGSQGPPGNINDVFPTNGALIDWRNSLLYSPGTPPGVVQWTSGASTAKALYAKPPNLPYPSNIEYWVFNGIGDFYVPVNALYQQIGPSIPGYLPLINGGKFWPFRDKMRGTYRGSLDWDYSDFLADAGGDWGDDGEDEDPGDDWIDDGSVGGGSISFGGGGGGGGGGKGFKGPTGHTKGTGFPVYTPGMYAGPKSFQ